MILTLEPLHIYGWIMVSRILLNVTLTSYPSLSPSLSLSNSLVQQLSKKVIKDTGLVDEETAGAISSVADAAENQAEAGRDATITDRLKMAGKPSLSEC